MEWSHLKRATQFEIKDWIEENIPELTTYQKERMRDDEMIRFSPFYFYKRAERETPNILWRLTVLVLPVYWLTMVVSLPFNMIITGTWGYGRKFIDGFHSKWMRKIGF